MRDDELRAFAREKTGQTLDALIGTFDSAAIATEIVLDVLVERMCAVNGTPATAKKLRDTAAAMVVSETARLH